MKKTLIATTLLLCSSAQGQFSSDPVDRECARIAKEYVEAEFKSYVNSEMRVAISKLRSLYEGDKEGFVEALVSLKRVYITYRAAWKRVEYVQCVIDKAAPYVFPKPGPPNGFHDQQDPDYENPGLGYEPGPPNGPPDDKEFGDFPKPDYEEERPHFEPPEEEDVPVYPGPRLV